MNSQSPSGPSAADSATDRLQMLVGNELRYLKSDPPRLYRVLCGDQCALVGAAREALAPGGNARPLLTAIVQLQHAEIANLYQDLTRPVSAGLLRQGQAIFAGLTAVLRAVVSRGPAKIKGFDREELHRAIAAFNVAWPTLTRLTGKLNATDTIGDPRFPDYAAQHGDAKGTRRDCGFWVVWNIIATLCAQSGSPANLIGRGSTPVLLYHDVDHGRVARLTVDLLDEAGGGFYPDPLAMGLTIIEPRFYLAMQRAWRRSGLAFHPDGSERPLRGCWRVTTYSPAFPGPWEKPLPALDDNHFSVPILSGRSVEAAALAAIWSAWGDIPGEQGPLVKLDLADDIAVTAKLGKRPTGGTLRDIPIESVAYEHEKSLAADAQGISQMLVAKRPAVAALGKPHLTCKIQPLATMGEVFDWLTGMQRYIEGYKRTTIDLWADNDKRIAAGYKQGEPHPFDFDATAYHQQYEERVAREGSKR